MKTWIKADGANNCNISFDCPYTGERVHMCLSAPRYGGYVRDDSGRQIYERLSRHGNALSWDGLGQLADMIRVEYRRMRAVETREFKS